MVVVRGPQRAREWARSPAGGTGSYPRPPQGWQRQTRRAVSHSPRIGPCALIASSPYALHEGVNRHRPPITGPSVARYTWIIPSSGADQAARHHPPRPRAPPWAVVWAGP